MEAYLDNAATTRCCEEAILAMENALRTDYGNPSALHSKGMEAENLVKKGREVIAKSLRVKEKEILFTSGGTESNNLAILGAARAGRRAGNRIITSAVEHPSVRNVMKELSEEGFEVITLPVNREGEVSLEALSEALTEDTILLSLMLVNNEIGTVQPVEEASRLLKERAPKALFHVDAIQGYGKLEIFPAKQGIDLLSVSGHKLHGPKGIGFLYKSEKARILPILYGGGQQEGYRSGTENVPGIAGLTAAVQRMDPVRDGAEMRRLRGIFLEGLREIPGVSVNGGEREENAAPHIISVSVSGVRSEVLLHALESEGVYVSAGSACSSHKRAASETLTAIGLPKELLDKTIRVSLSAETKEEEIRYALETMKRVIPGLQKYTRR